MDTLYLHDADRRTTAAILALVDHSALKGCVTKGVENMIQKIELSWPYPSTGQELLWKAALSMKGHGSVNLLEVFRVIDEDSARALTNALAIFAGVRSAA